MKGPESGLDPAPVFLLCEGALCDPLPQMSSHMRTIMYQTLCGGPQTAAQWFLQNLNYSLI